MTFRYDARAALARIGRESDAATVATPATETAGVAAVAGVAASPVALADLAAFSEAAAILEHDHGLSRRDAEEAAAAEQGFVSAPDLWAAVVEEWRSGLEGVAAGAGDRAAKRATAAALRFVSDGWAEKALALGWLEADLVGTDPHAPWARLDRLGAAYSVEPPAAITATAIVYGGGCGGRMLFLRGSRPSGGRPPW